MRAEIKSPVLTPTATALCNNGIAISEIQDDHRNPTESFQYR
jgi:hypothetical protein